MTGINITMDINEFKEILNNISRIATEGLQELRGNYEMCNQWLAEVDIDLSKPKRKRKSILEVQVSVDSVSTSTPRVTRGNEEDAKTSMPKQEVVNETFEITPKKSLLPEQEFTAVVTQAVTPSEVLQNSPEDTPKVDSQTFLKDKTSSSIKQSLSDDALASNRDKAISPATSSIKQTPSDDVLASDRNNAISPATSSIKQTPSDDVLASDRNNAISPATSSIKQTPSDDVLASNRDKAISPAALQIKESYVVLKDIMARKSKDKAMSPILSNAKRIPYAKEPIRERIAAFESLRMLSEEPEVCEAVQVQTETRVTRTKTRAMAKAAAKAIEKNDNVYQADSTTEPPKSIYSQNAWKAARKSVAKAKMTKPSNIVVGIDSFIPKQAVKPTFSEIQVLKEEEIRRKEGRMQETIKKREEALKARIEEQKRKREERMKKVLQQREALEQKKKCEELRVQKEKDEKLKHVIQEREERIKEQLQQKKQLAQQKAAEIEERRRVEEAARMAKLKEQVCIKQYEVINLRLNTILAFFFKTIREALHGLGEGKKERHDVRDDWDKEAKLIQLNAQLLKEKQMKVEEKLKMLPPKAAMNETFEIPVNEKVPNPNSYEIDTSGRDQRLPVLKAQVHVQKRLFESLFTCEEKTPNILDMFKEFKTVKNVTRSSSAVWRTPPRYSTLRRFQHANC
ncbi:hypothetical protein C0J52_18985 [Blattella germanica]|nr:hypothetical protein C0J52_18985 [Blattella germanica]